jgi:ferric-dicitrate binding protein FerR (iron transport regulator)
VRLRDAYKAACDEAVKLYKPGEKPPEWQKACRHANELWQQLKNQHLAKLPEDAAASPPRKGNKRR